MDDTPSWHGGDGAGVSLWPIAGTRTLAAVGGFRHRGPAFSIWFSHGDLTRDQGAIRLLCIRSDVLRTISGSCRLESMDHRLDYLTVRSLGQIGNSTEQVLRAPIDGIVQQLALHTVGVIVTPALTSRAVSLGTRAER